MAVHLQGDVWICMELMDTSLDKFYRKVLDKGMTIPEDILGEIAVSVSGVGGVPMVVSWAELGPPCGLQLWPCSWAAAFGSPKCPHPGPEPSCSGDPGVLEPHRFSRARISGPSCASPEFGGHRRGLSVHSFLILKMLGGSSQRHAVRGENHGSVS